MNSQNYKKRQDFFILFIYSLFIVDLQLTKQPSAIVDVISLIHVLTFELNFRYMLIFSLHCNKFCWSQLKTLAVSKKMLNLF